MAEHYETAAAAVKRMSWSAVFAGVVVVLVIQLMLGMLGLGIGMSAVDPLPQGDGSPEASTFGIATAIWWVVVTLIAAFAGGSVAGRLAGTPVRTDGILHGLITWGFATLLLFYLLTTTVGNLIGGTFSVVGNVASSVGQGVQRVVTNAIDAAGGETLREIQQEAEQLLSQAQAQGAELQLEQAVRDLIGQLVRGELSAADLENAIREIANRAGLSEEEVRTTVEQWQSRYQEALAAAEREARQAAEVAASTLSSAGFWSFVALLLGAIAGAVGGMIGTPHDLRR